MAKISLLHPDSTVLRVSQAGQDGSFFFPGPFQTGLYYLLITYPAYEPLYQLVRIRDSLLINLGIVTLHRKSDSLQAVIVRASDIRPKMKGDTIEYNTTNIVMAPNAVVEELLGRLPGLQIGPDGAMTYNGEKIQKLLVDGEDLFGSDPTLVTRGFDASTIAKVQVLDKKTDQTAFTGIDDGTRIKTLNLVLKTSAKNGYFGKVEAGGDPEDYYNVNGLLADFQGREQVTALGMASNTGVMGFTSNSGGGNARLTVVQPSQDPLGTSAGTGIPRVAAAGLHYANTWDGQANHLTGNGQFGHLFTQPVTSTQTLQTLSDTLYNQDQRSASTNNQDEQFFDLRYDYLPDSLSAWAFFLAGVNLLGQNQFNSGGNSSFNGVSTNSSQTNIQSVVGRTEWRGIVFWHIRARRQAARVLSFSAEWHLDNITSNGYLYSLDRFYHPNGSLQSIDTVDQRKQIGNKTLSLNGSANYTEPLWRGAVLGLSYKLAYDDNHSLQGTYNKTGGEYTDYIDSLSSHLHAETVNQTASLNIQGKYAHLNYSLGSDLLHYNYRQQDLLTDSLLHLHYLNLNPHAFIIYNKNPVLYFNLTYQGTIQQPSIAQLEPVTNNSNPLYITLGNPNLKPGFNQNLYLSFRWTKAWLINVGLTAGLTGNSISTKTTTDSLGRQISQPVNVNGGQNAGLNFSINKSVLGIEAGLHTNFSYSRTLNYINADLNSSDNFTEGGGFSVNRYVADQYSLQFNAQFTYLDTRSSVNTTAPIHYWTQNHTGSVTLFFIHGYEINTNAVYTWQQATSAFAGNTSMLLWNAGISRNLLKNRLVIRFQANNLLNENAGISRTSNTNINTQSSTNILGRYWMVFAAYHFDHHWKRK